MGRSAKSFERKTKQYIVGAKVLIICEDLQSSKIYLEDAKKHFGVDAIIEVAHIGCTDPLNIVQHAISRSGSFDSIYCVIDRDTHETFDAACKLLRGQRTNVDLVVSYPCFEFWLFLHFKYSRKSYNRAGSISPGAQMLADLQKIPQMATYAKGQPNDLFEKLLPKLGVARAHASKVLSDALEVNELNPSTRMHELFDAFEALARLR
jgi:hypothetical protein